MRRAALSALSLDPFLPARPEKLGSASRQIQPGVVKGTLSSAWLSLRW